MADLSHEGSVTAEPELDQAVAATQADRLDRELTEALMTLPQYRASKRVADERGETIIRFGFGDLQCEDGTNLREGGSVQSRDLTLEKIVDGREVVQSYSLDRLTEKERQAPFKKPGLRTEITVIHGPGSEDDREIYPTTQTAVDEFDAQIQRIRNTPRLHLVPPTEK